VSGVIEDTCTPGAPAADDATCDGVDDDCDGAFDEDYLSVPTSCGVGACTASGISSCAGGTVQDSCVPGPPSIELCDGVDNDCDGQKDEGEAVDAATWYMDADGDSYGDPSNPLDACSRPGGFVTNSTDCDDSNANTYPGAFEFNDGEDNQCDGEPGHGLADEIAGVAGFHDPANDANYSWPAQPGATLYEVKRSSKPDFSADCTTFTNSNSLIYDSETPAPGGTFFYLVRSLTPFAGSWGQNSARVERRNGTVGEEADPAQVYSGFRAERLTRTGADALSIANSGIPLSPGQTYLLSFVARFSLALPDAVQVRVRNLTRGEDLQAGGTWSPALSPVGFDLTTDYEQHELQFVVDPDYGVEDEFRLVIRHQSGAPIGSELWIDDVAIRAE